MSRAQAGKNDPPSGQYRLKTGSQLHTWRLQHGLSAKRIGALIGVTERSIHRAERSRHLGAKVKLAMALLQARISLGEIIIPTSTGGDRQAHTPEESEAFRVMDHPGSYGTPWKATLPTGADLRAWREAVGLYQKEVASLLDVDVTTLLHAEKSEVPSSRLVYGVEQLRSKIENGELDLERIKKRRVHRGRPKKR
jgi:transcriptional regulator with XRE-family HTH domain